MRILANLFLSTAIFLFIASCSGGQSGRGSVKIQRGPMPEGGTWAGIWFTNWGELSLSIQGDSIVGEFCQESHNKFGRLEGTARGKVATFHWITQDVTMRGRPRESDGSAIVQFSFVQSGENQTPHFEGTWGFGNSNDDGGILRGERSRTRSNRFLNGQYSIPCALKDQTEDSEAPLSNDDVGDNPEPEELNPDDEGDEGIEFGDEDEL